MKAIWSKDGNLYDARVMKKHDNGKFFWLHLSLACHNIVIKLFCLVRLCNSLSISASILQHLQTPYQRPLG